LPKVDPEILKAFGKAVKRERAKRGWDQKTLGNAVKPPVGNSLVSKIEKGQKDALDILTVGRFRNALDLDEDWLDKFLDADETPDSSEDKAERDADLIFDRLQREGATEGASDELLILLANTYAQGTHRNRETAYVGVRKALISYSKMTAQGTMKGNADDQYHAVMAEVAKLNNAGDVDEADALLDQEERRMEEAHKADADRKEQQANTMLTQRLDQDRLRNRPDLAAERIIKNLRQFPQGGKLFWAVNTKANEWTEQGNKAGDLFALRVGLEIAKSNYENHKTRSALAAAALRTLGWCHFRLAERSTNERHLKVARTAFEAAVQKTSKTSDPLNWSARQDGLGQVLLLMGERAADVDLLRKSVSAHRTALDLKINHKSKNIEHGWESLGISLSTLGELTRDPSTLTEAVDALRTALALADVKADQIDWAGTQSNLALAQRRLGDFTDDLPTLNTARQGYGACEALDYRTDAPFDWAQLQWNIADLALARYRLDPDPALLSEAKTHVTAARAFFVDGSDYQTERCDGLLTKIKTAEAARP
jgi:transcriptional regulator with XRE-family HTH domain